MKTERKLTIALLLLLVYPSFTEVLQRYLGTGLFRFVPLLAGAVLLCVGYVRGKNDQLLLGVNLSGEVILWMVLLVLAVYRNYDIRYLQNLGGIGIFIVVVALVPFLSCRTEWIDTFYRVLMLYMAVHIAVTLICYAFPAVFNDWISPALGNTPTGGDPGYMYGLWKNFGYNAFCIAIGMLILVANAMATRKKVYIVVSLLALFALLLTNKRGPLIFCVGTILLTWFLVTHKDKDKVKKMCLLAVGLIAVYGILAWKFPEALRVFDRFSADSGEDISTGRFTLYEEAISLFLEHPLIGAGWSGFRFYYNTVVLGSDSFAASDVHNIYIQVLCETGIIGFSVFLLIAYFSLRNAVYIILHWDESMGCGRQSVIASVSIQLFVLLYGLTGNTLYVPTLFTPYVLACAATYAIRLRQQTVELRSPSSEKQPGRKRMSYHAYRDHNAQRTV